MKLIYYNPKNLPTRVFGNGKPIVRFPKCNVIRFSQEASDILKLSDGMRVQFANDFKKPKDWYILISNDGFNLRKNKGEFVFSSKALCNKIRESLKIIDRNFYLQLCKDPTQDNGSILHALLTSNA